MSVRWPDHSSQHQSVTSVYVPLKINAMDVNAEMHNTGPLFLLVPPFPSKMPLKDKTLAGLVLGCLHLESLNSLKGQARRFMAYPGTLSSSIWEWDEHLFDLGKEPQKVWFRDLRVLRAAFCHGSGILFYYKWVWCSNGAVGSPTGILLGFTLRWTQAGVPTYLVPAGLVLQAETPSWLLK